MRARARAVHALPYVVLAALCYLPLVLTAPGAVVPDTKPYLTIDPGRLLRRALSLWDPGIGLGTVTHQTIGYLWPMGPYHWVLDGIGVPDWLAQRLWLGSILFAAGTGVVFLLRSFGVRTGHGMAAALPYVLTPYVLGYAAVTAILLPYAGLPWMVALVVRGLRRGGWRHPALFALVVTTVGSINATALLCAGLGALCWVPLAVWSRREVTAGRAVATLARMGVLTLVTQLWWLVALVIDGAYGASILEVTETIETTAATSLASEVVRGLGYWFFYGGDRLGPWVRAAPPFQTEPWLIAVGFVLPVVAVASAAVLRWSVRTYAVVLLVVGTAVAVGAHPYASPPPLGRALKLFAEESSFGLALRNSQRAVPLVVLGFALVLGGAVAALARRSPKAALAATLAIGVVAAAANPALWTGALVDPETKRDDDVPAYWREAAEWLEADDDGSRVLELPGADFAAYRWGTTTDPVTPGLMDRPSISKELVPSGGDESVDLISALDRRLQEGVFESDAVAPVARLMGAGDVLLRSDLQYERYRTPRPRTTWQQFTPPPAGLDAPVTFGASRPNRAVARLPLEDEIDLAVPAAVPDPPPIAIFPVADAVPIVRAKPTAGAVTVAGDAEGLVDLAAAGVLRGDELVRFSRDLTPADLQAGPAAAGPVVVTDSNRRRARRWSTVRDNFGFTEPRGFVPLRTEGGRGGNQPVPTAGDASSAAADAGADDTKTVVEYRGIDGVAATDYGNIISYTPEHRPFSAVDGDVTTAWRVGAFSNPEGARWRLDLDAPLTVDRLTIVQPQSPTDNRYLTAVSIRFDDGPWEPFDLDERSRAVEGQELRFAARTFQRVEVRVDDTNIGRRPVYDGLSSVGIAELRIADVVADEVVRVPRDLLARAETTAGRPLWFSFTRARSDPAVVVRSDEEPALARAFALPEPRAFGLEATVRLSAAVPDLLLDELLGTAGRVRANSSGRLPGDIRARASSAIDGDPTTAWSPGFLEQRGHWIDVTLPQPTVVERLDLELLADGRHSIPTRLRITNEAGDAREVQVPHVDAGGRGTVVSRPVTFAPLPVTTLRVTVVDVEEDLTRDYFSTQEVAAPVAIVELGIPGVTRDAGRDEIPSECRPGLVTLDGRPFGLRLVGARADAEARRGIRALPCGSGAAALAAGEHELRSTPGTRTGVDVDRIVLASSAGRGAADPAGPAQEGAVPPAPRLAVAAPSRSSFRIEVTGTGEPFWLVLGQSRNRGWEGTVAGRPLPEAELVDGFANGWLIDLDEGRSATIALTWAPQRIVRASLVASLLGALLCLALVARSFGRRREPVVPLFVDDDPDLGAPTAGAAGPRWRTGARLGVLAVLFLLVVPPAQAALVAGTAGLVLLLSPRWRRRARVLLVAVAAGALAAAGLYTALLQARYGYPAGFHWPREFGTAHRLAWSGILLVAADAVLGAERPAAAAPPRDLSGSTEPGAR